MTFILPTYLKKILKSHMLLFEICKWISELDDFVFGVLDKRFLEIIAVG